MDIETLGKALDELVEEVQELQVALSDCIDRQNANSIMVITALLRKNVLSPEELREIQQLAQTVADDVSDDPENKMVPDNPLVDYLVRKALNKD